jgi:hypothetical protein
MPLYARLFLLTLFCLGLTASSASAQHQISNSGVRIAFQSNGIYSNPGNFIACGVSARVNPNGQIEIGGCIASSATGIPGATYSVSSFSIVNSANGETISVPGIFNQRLPGATQPIPFPQKLFTPASPVLDGRQLQLIFVLSTGDGNGFNINTTGKANAEQYASPNPRAPGNYNYTTFRYGPEEFAEQCGVFAPVTPCPSVAGSSFSASPSSINNGQSSTLTWNVPNASSVTIAGVGTFAPSGSVVVSPTSDTTYTLTSAGQDDCAPIQLQTTINVAACQSINSYSASATTINQGDTITLSYALTNASSATITDLTSGAVTSLPVQSGSVAFTPATSRTYRLSAIGACATVTQDINITVVPTPAVVSFSSNVGSVCPGGQATLSYNTSNATSADINGTPVGLPSGSLLVTPAAPSSTYTLTVRGGVGGGVVRTQQLTVTVNPAPSIVNFAASSPNIVQGNSTTLSYSTANGTSATITDLTSGSVSNVAVPDGSLPVSPATTRTYRLTLTNSCGTVTQDVTVNVTACQTIGSFTASASNIVQGQSTTLSYTLTGASSATITDLTSGAVSNVPVQSGSLPVSPATTRTYRLTVVGACATLTQDIVINVTACQIINSFSASATAINAGQSTTLSYTLSGASSATITDLTSGAVSNVPVQSGTLVVNPPTSRTYRLTVNGSCAAITQDLAITVNQPPTIASLSASPTSICAGQSTNLTWTSSGGTSATITDLASGVVSNVVLSGSQSFSPASTRSYRLTVTNAAGSVSSDVAVTVMPLSVINSFGASAATVNVGQSTTLSFNVSNSTLRSITDLSTGTATNLATEAGTLVVTPATTRTYRLTATNGCNSVTSDVTITVTQAPVISTFASNVGSVCAGGSATLSWSATGGTSASISAPGLPGSPVTVNPNSGTLVVNPTTTTTYTLTVTNGAGSVTRTVTVTVTPPPTISSFTATPANINEGQSSTLSWSTSGGTQVRIQRLSDGTILHTTTNLSGTFVVTPSISNQYRLIVDGACGPVTRDVNVTVTACQTIASLSASATSIGAGQSTTLSYSMTGATSASITDLSTGIVTSVPVQSGTLAVSPATTRTYRLTANGPCGAVTQDITITVTACQTINSFTVNASSSNTTATQGSTITVAWNISNFTSAQLRHFENGTPIENIPITTATGSLTFTQPSSSSAFRLTVEGACSSIFQELTVTTVCATVTINSFTATPAIINNGQSSTVAFNVTNATSVIIRRLSDNVDIYGVNSGAPATGSVSVTPTATTTYRLLAGTTGGCPVTQQDVTVTVDAPALLIGPQGQPDAFGPTSNNDDYSNMTLTAGVNVPSGGTTTAGGVITFQNTVLNISALSQNLTLRATSVPAGFTVETTTDGVNWINLGTSSLSGTLSANQSFTLSIRVTAPSGLSVLAGHSIVLRVSQAANPAIFNETIDRVYTGFIRAVKSQTVTNSTAIGAANAAVRGAVIEYVVIYDNITTASGTGNVNLTATNLVLTEDGNAAPNNWGTTTDHVPGSASDTRGGTITGDVAGSTLIRDTVSSLPPQNTGTFRFRRVIR